jgi:thiamine biosynthesis lipoprotein
MGTSYRVAYVLEEGVAQNEVRSSVETELVAISAQASTWDDQSELSRFNAHASTEPFEVSPELVRQVEQALALARETGGAFDPTVMPLVRLYGFAVEAAPQAPDPEEIEAVREHVGHELVRVEGARLVKSDPRVELDLSGIAKGDGVDRIGAVLDELGATAWLVEIGGEVRTRGRKPDGTTWLVGIELPREGAAFGDELGHKLRLEGAALATSGDYRRFRDVDGRRVHHVLDPRTGTNATHDLAAVTVVAPTCAQADGLATALLVMGADEGLPYVERCAGVEALFVRRNGRDGFTTTASTGWAALAAVER